MTDTLDLKWNTWPVCPHCGKEDNGAWEWGMNGDGDSMEVDCGYCEKDYRVTMCLDITYSTEKVPDA